MTPPKTSFLAELKAAISASRRKFDWIRALNYVVAGAILLYGDKPVTDALTAVLPGKSGTEILKILGLIAAASPRVLKATGLFRPVSPDQTSVMQDVLNYAGTALTAYKAQKAEAKTNSMAAAVAPAATKVALEAGAAAGEDAAKKAIESLLTGDYDVEALLAGIAAKKAALNSEKQPGAMTSPVHAVGLSVEAVPIPRVESAVP